LRCRGSEHSQHSLIQELQELRKLDHRHLVHIIGSYSDPHYIAYLMKPVADLTLADFLNTSHTLGTKEKLVLRRFYGCLAGAMNYLFTQRVRHRDFTARNILIDSAGEVYVSDFGSSYNWSSKANSKTRHRNVPTSPDYMAPELAKGGEHSTKSDMWSLGLVYLEMTTKLLEHRPSEMQRRIRDAAGKNKTQPYPYANLPVIHSWMQLLGSTGSDSDYDREPLSWIRELLYAESEHRLTTAQLMKYILESPSFGVFCCLKCQDDFQSESFAYSSSRPIRKDSNGESKRTRETVEAFFESDPADHMFRGLSEKRTDSIKQWLQDSAPSDFPMAELPGTGFPEGPVGDDEDVLLPDNMFSDQLLYSSYEYEYYNPSGITTTFLDSGSGGYFVDNQIASQNSEPVELLADTSWGADPETQIPSPSREVKKEVLLRDSGLGFLEYLSDSSDSEKALQLFEEVSDRSSVNSGEEEEDVAALRDDPLCSFLTEASPAPKRFTAPGDSLDDLFDVEVDLSDVENPWDEASDRSEPEVAPEAVASDSGAARSAGRWHWRNSYGANHQGTASGNRSRRTGKPRLGGGRQTLQRTIE
jgi:serine/threonine protein kinase